MHGGVAVQVGDPGVEETVVGITTAGRASLMLVRRCGTACFRSVYAGVHSSPRRVRARANCGSAASMGQWSTTSMWGLMSGSAARS